MTTIPGHIKAKRQKLKETQAQFGKRFGKSHAAVSEWESGKAEAPYYYSCSSFVGCGCSSSDQILAQMPFFRHCVS